MRPRGGRADCLLMFACETNSLGEEGMRQGVFGSWRVLGVFGLDL